MNIKQQVFFAEAQTYGSLRRKIYEQQFFLILLMELEAFRENLIFFKDLIYGTFCS